MASACRTPVNKNASAVENVEACTRPSSPSWEQQSCTYLDLPPLKLDYPWETLHGLISHSLETSGVLWLSVAKERYFEAHAFLTPAGSTTIQHSIH